MRSSLVFTALVATACASKPTPQSEEAVEHDRSATEARRSDIEACFTAMDVAESPTDEAVSGIVGACKKLWLDQGCRDAWAGAIDASPASRAEGVIAGCGRSICPTLEPPKPALCTAELSSVDLLADDPDWGELWKEFNTTVLVADLGLPPGDTRGAILAMRLLQLVAISSPPSKEMVE